MNKKIEILIVEDEHIVAMELKSRLLDLGYSVCAAVASGEEAIEKSIEFKPSLILMDINIKGNFDGVETAKKIMKIHEIPIIFLTAFTDDKTLERAKLIEPYGYIVKPFEERELYTTIEIAIHKYSMEAKLRDSERKLSTILASIGDAVIATDKVGKINFANQSFEVLTNFENMDLLGKNIFDVFLVEDENALELIKQGIQLLLSNNAFKDFPSQISIKTKFNEVKIVEFKISTLLNEQKLINGIVLTIHDITEKFHSAIDVIESEMKYQKVIENVSDIIFTADINGKFMFVNPAGLKASGFTLEELRQIRFDNLVLSSHREYCKRVLIRQYFQKQKSTYMEFPFIAKSGDIIWFAQSTSLIFEDGKVVGYNAIARDITDKILAEKKLNDRNKFIETILENIQIGLSVHDIRNGKIIFSNSKFKDIYGYSHNEIATTKEFIKAEIPDEHIRKEIQLKIIHKLRSAETICSNCESVTIHPPKGDKKVISISIISLKEQNIVIATSQDVTSQKYDEEKILRLSYAVDQSPAAVLITNHEGKIVYANSKFIEMTGYYFADITDRRPCSFHSPTGEPDDEHEITKSVKEGKELKGEFISYRKDGSSYWEYVIVSPIRNSKNEISNFLIIKQDISEQKRFENELIAAKNSAEESSRLKTVFLGNMSHELRTPMVGILGFSQILKEELTDDEQIELADLLIKSGKRLLNTLESILELSQLESNNTSLKLIEYDLSTCVDSIYQKFKDQAAEKKLSFKIDKSEEEINILVDEKLLKQALNNIVDNAIKFTYQGGVKIEIDKTRVNEVEYAAISVSDTGIGIPMEQQKIIFEDFRQVSEGTSRSFEGNGLGLSITKKIIQLMNGKILIDSEPKKGSIFTVLIPRIKLNSTKTINQANLQKTELNERGKINKKTKPPEVLLVEDNETNKSVIELYLKNICKIDHSFDGKTALKLAEQKQYDLILMDINLGDGLNGIQVTQKIREYAGYEKVPIVALTGYAMYGDKERLLAEGCSHYLSKPFMKKDLVQLVERLLDNSKDYNSMVLS